MFVATVNNSISVFERFQSLDEAAASAGAATREEAERVDPVIQAFGRTLARVLVRNVRARRLAR